MTKKFNRTAGGVFFLAAIGIATAAPFLLGHGKGGYVAPVVADFSRTDLQWVNERVAPYCQPVSTQKAIYTQPTDPSAVNVPVFIYHRITDDDKPSHEITRPEMFRQQMRWLKDNGYNTITVSQLTEYMNGQPVTLPPKPVAVTFDDGWKDNLEAFKFLKELDYGATMFVISGFFESEMYVTEQETKAVADTPKFEIGSHSHTHFTKFETQIDKLDLCTMATEMAGSRRILERVTGKPVRSIAWPYGHNTHEAVYVAGKLGYTSTLMVNDHSENRPGQSPLFISRMNIDGNCGLAEFKSMAETGKLKECS